MKLVEGPAEHQQNFARLPQHPESSPITWLEVNTFSPVQSALKFAWCDQQSKLFLQNSPTLLKFLISTEAKWSKMLPPCVAWTQLITISCSLLPWTVCSATATTFSRLSLHSQENEREIRHFFTGGWKRTGSLVTLAQIYFHRLATTMEISGTIVWLSLAGD